jgi:pimeloyl-ACP methyl ester carboxylesterase
VPLDHFNGTHPGESVSIAITKLPARVSIDDPRYGGPILINPGGPGGPGALFNLGVGKQLQTVADSAIHPEFDSTDAIYYDIIGFDPRGIGETEPHAYCTTDAAAAWSWSLREDTVGLLGSSDASLGRLWSMSHAWGNACKQEMDEEDGPDIKQYMTTAFVARDMLQIVEKHASFVAKTSTGRDQKNNEDIADFASQAKLNYWGFSYGTLLGSTFASMYPDRVGRFMLDGVVSSYDYVHSLGNGSLTDSQKVMHSFYTYCLYVGPDSCLLATPDSTYNDIEDRVSNIVQLLYHNPLPLNTTTGPEVLTHSDVKMIMFSSLYLPHLIFPYIAQLLVELEVGYGDLLDTISNSYRNSHIFSCSRSGAVDYSSYVPTYAVLCSDSIDETHLDIEEFNAYWDYMESMFPASAAIWATHRMRCASWKIKASYKFHGPFGGNTSNPILFVSNTADPVTPLRSARLMHSLFPGSGLLVSDQAGHCSSSAPNLCTLAHIKAYYQTGALSPPNTLCIPPPGPFSLNSTDPKSPFYDPEIGKMTAEMAPSNIVCYTAEQAALSRAGHGIARGIAEQDFFGVGRFVGGSGVLVREFMAMSVEGYRI